MSTQRKDTRKQILAVGRRLTAERGFVGVGLSDLLKEAGVPKGSFYHYFASKEDYGCALLESFADDYRQGLADTLNNPSLNAHDRFLAYFQGWIRKQTGQNPEERCLVVKLAAEVSDLSDSMSGVLQNAVDGIVEALTQTLRDGIAEGSVARLEDPAMTARAIYHQWLGASLVAGLSGSVEPLESALKSTASAIRPM